MLEAPRWFGDRLWICDIFTASVLSSNADGSDLRVEANVPGLPLGLGRLPDGRLLVASVQDERILSLEPDGSLRLYADLAGSVQGAINDMIVDPQGRCWVGCTGFDLGGGEEISPGIILRIDPDGTVEVAADGILYSNGIVCDGRTLVIAESLGNRLSAFDVSPAGGLTNRRDWALFGAVPQSKDPGEVLATADVVPDGISDPDADGAIWVADALHHRVLRVADGGAILQEIAFSDTQVFAAALGGPVGKTLFLATAPGFAAHERMNTRESALRSVEVEVGAAVLHAPIRSEREA